MYILAVESDAAGGNGGEEDGDENDENTVAEEQKSLVGWIKSPEIRHHHSPARCGLGVEKGEVRALLGDNGAVNRP